MDIEEIVTKIRTQKITARKVFLCYALNAGTVGLKLNNIGDVDFETGLLEAEKADELVKMCKSPEDLPYLLGLPISIKDHVRVKGLIDTLGYCCNTENISKEDSYVVKRLRELGAIILCKSNVCQGLMSAESTNKVWGASSNIWNSSRTTGGSSGGEGGLVGSFCSPIGIGTDIAGSLRIPGSFNGVCGFKPTSNRISTKGHIGINGDSYSAWPFWDCSCGIIGKNVKDVVYLSKHLFGSFNEDYTSDQRKFNDDEFTSNRKLKVGYFHNTSLFETCKDIKLSIDKLITKLNENKEYDVEEVNLDRFLELYYKGYEVMINGDGVFQIYEGLKGENVEYFYADYKPLLDSSDLKLSIGKKILKTFTSETRTVTLLDNIKIFRNMKQFYEGGEKFLKLRDDFIKYLKDNKFDALVLPVYPCPAPLIGNALITNSTTFYNLIGSMCNFASISIPTGTLENTNYSSKYSDKVSKLMIDDISKAKDMPISIQIAALPGKDEVCLRLASESALIFKVPFNKLEADTVQSKNFWDIKGSFN